MRLFRRTLLCLVVGVTAFGAAGWVLRPKPSWTVEIPSPYRQTAPKAIAVVEDDVAPIWVSWDSQFEAQPGQHDWEAELLAVDPRTGAALNRLSRRGRRTESASILSNGALLWTNRPDSRGARSKSYEYVASVPDASPIAFTLEGDWKLNKQGRFLWRLKPLASGFEFQRTESIGDTQTSGFECPDRFPFCHGHACDVSDDGRWLAVCHLDEDVNFSTNRVEIWDVSKRRVAHWISVPKSNPEWNKDAWNTDVILLRFRGSQVMLSKRFGHLGDLDFWVATVDDESFRDAEGSRPPTTPDKRHVTDRLTYDRGKDDLWLASDLSGEDVHLFVNDVDDRSTRWRRCPFEIIGGAHSGYAVRGYTPTTAVAMVPHRDEAVCVAIVPSLSALAPERLRPMLPSDYRDLKTQKTFWHDVRQNVWRDVGCSSDENLVQLRSNAYVTESPTQGLNAQSTIRLQSWPLPPRDPKWPALGVAITCAAATWWMCARRYRRRMNRAAVPA